MICDFGTITAPGEYTCTRRGCGRIASIVDPSLPIRTNPCRGVENGQPRLPPVAVLQKAIHLAGAVAKFAAASPVELFKKGALPVVSPATYRRRLESGCNQCRARTVSDSCGLCGCGIKGKVINKAQLASETCDLGHWIEPFKGEDPERPALLHSAQLRPLYHLEGLHRGGSCFLLGGGPSLNGMDLEPLRQRGILTAAVNNVAATHLRPQLWFCVDHPQHFSANIWEDPGIFKFVPLELLGRHYRRRRGPRFLPARQPVRSCPAVFAYRRNQDFRPDRFFTEPTVNWGNLASWTDELGIPGGRSVMLPAIRVLAHLGVRRIYLLGCDFLMTPDQSYAFDQPKDKRACDNNNRRFGMLDRRLHALRPAAAKIGLEIRNATPGGNMQAFDRIDYAEAIERCLGQFPRTPDTRGLYQL